ncbi:YceD family protein [Rhodoferax sp.]|uniref:YceD family protein n=1 Tax=Rhodoferax sp. TaxID=50421 RepID=UPI00273120AA|nr:YceD family protein [Rhodoferax sp.]MDP1530119.1 YceD family protein [Rhodoferax sp.]MDP1943483.1 YceD family protein [Rhodoferax sp.]MDP2443246.1 YceD family protein [Rhodoferax sp.]MDZ4206770.1 YceD family protein [Rhodoferax sp.]
MTTYQRPPKLDVKHAGQASQQLSGQDALAHYERLMEETQSLGGQNTLNWTARGELASDAKGQLQPWLYLSVSTSLPLTCQRCLGPVDVPVQIERAFRFVETEAQAEQEDDESPEDVLVLSRDFDLAALIEDEVLMDLPAVPRHDTCPLPVKLTAVDPDFEAPSPKPSPFAVLAGLKGAGKL